MERQKDRRPNNYRPFALEQRETHWFNIIFDPFPFCSTVSWFPQIQLVVGEYKSTKEEKNRKKSYRLLIAQWWDHEDDFKGSQASRWLSATRVQADDGGWWCHYVVETHWGTKSRLFKFAESPPLSNETKLIFPLPEQQQIRMWFRFIQQEPKTTKKLLHDVLVWLFGLRVIQFTGLVLDTKNVVSLRVMISISVSFPCWGFREATTAKLRLQVIKLELGWCNENMRIKNHHILKQGKLTPKCCWILCMRIVSFPLVFLMINDCLMYS